MAVVPTLNLYLFLSFILFIASNNRIVAQEDEQRSGILYPQDSETRELKSLDGIWQFRLAPRLQPELGFQQQWYSKPLAETGDVDLMPVPSSYNDITQKKEVRDHIGWAWYDRTFHVPNEWQTDRRIFLRFGAASYQAIVYMNGEKIVEHSGGALPFLAELDSSNLNFKNVNRLTVAINNTLTADTLPQGTTVWQTSSRYPEGYFTLNYNFDWFNYAGIHRSVFLYTTPRNFIDDIDVTPAVNGTTGLVKYSIKVKSDELRDSKKIKAAAFSVSLVDKQGSTVATSAGESGVLEVPNANLWWPFTMVQDDKDAGYLYTLVVTLTDDQNEGGNDGDVYRLKVGIRSVTWSNKEFFINGKPFYFRGYGRHEDFNVRGKGIDNVLIVKDHNLVKWTGANSYRTSHYPYSEEIMDLTDRLGIVIIDEVAACTIGEFGSGLLANHKEQMRELVQRDKNRASVVMWSVANEPLSQMAAAQNYFKEVIELTRELDVAGRPVTLVTDKQYDADLAAQYVDILSVNRYFSWYSDPGHTEVIAESMRLDVENWVRKFDKPLIITEYGADTVAGLHMSPEFVFTEEYQTTMMREHFKAFDYLRTNSSLIGEHIWNFADFMTVQGITRITGNRKGIFTRDRQPKASAHLLRLRYHLLAAEADSYPVPDDLQETIPVFKEPIRLRPSHDEH